VIVTDRGKPVTRLERIQSRKPPAILEPLIASGRLIDRPPPRDPPEPIEMDPGEKTLLDYVREQRDPKEEHLAGDGRDLLGQRAARMS
jgi:hypothetical protein